LNRGSSGVFFPTSRLTTATRLPPRRRKGKAIDCYLAYRHHGGENHSGSGRISLAVTESLLAGDPAKAASVLQQQAPRFEEAGYGGFIKALQAIVAGSRNRALAEAPDLDFSMAAEILLLIETLEKAK
jgi:hypothetical protein